MTFKRVERFRRSRVRFLLLLLGLLGVATVAIGHSPADSRLPLIAANDNQHSAGKLEDGVLQLRLEIVRAMWFPESETGPSIAVYAFGEEGRLPQIPGPLIRVKEGTRIHITLRNRLDRAVSIHGVQSHSDMQGATITLQPGEMREVTFAAGVPGTYAYWASAGLGMWQDRPYKEDSQLAGAFVVDPKEGASADRIFVLGMWRDRPRPTESLDIVTINGRSWPYTERLNYLAGETVRWRVLNLSSNVHPMHLHGGYFQVIGTGDGEHNQSLTPDQYRTVSTELMPVGHSMDVIWTADNPGRWLFHCHILAHVSPYIMVFHQQDESHEMHSADHMRAMSGLVLGITVQPSATIRKASAAVTRPRQVELIVGSRPGGGMGYGVVDSEARVAPTLTAPGPPLVLTRGQPVDIRVINKLKEPTSVHWHGIELESYYDGVPGWTGMGKQVTPPIPAGKSFVARFTPPRAGTFIYHTHMNDLVQMSSGLYGAIIVLPPGEQFDPESDRIFIIGHTGLRAEDGKILLNGTDAPAPLHLKPDTTYRFRFINISPNTPTNVLLTSGREPVKWRHIAKDGADLPPAQAVDKPADLRIAPGETYDFEFHTAAMPLLSSLAVPVVRQELKQEIRVDH